MGWKDSEDGKWSETWVDGLRLVAHTDLGLRYTWWKASCPGIFSNVTLRSGTLEEAKEQALELLRSKNV